MTEDLEAGRSWWPAMRADAFALLALAVGIALVSWRGFATGSFLGRLDTVSFYMPWYTFLGERLRAGDLPGWLPYTMSGVPFAGDPQSGWGYMPAMAIFTLFSGPTGFEVLIVFHLALGAAGSYAFARVAGLGFAGSTVAAGAFTFAGLVERSRCCTIHVEVAVWAPVAFLGIEFGARARRSERRIAAWGITGVAVSQMIAGWIGQGAAYGLLAVAAYAVYRVALAPEPDERLARTRLVRLAALAAVSGLIAAILSATAIVPRLDVVDRSNLAGGSYEQVGGGAAETGGWKAGELIDRLLTQDDRAGRFYAGGAILALAILAPILARRRFRVAFFLPYGIIVPVLTLHETVVHRLFYLIPEFEQLHAHRPERVLTVFPLAPAMLAGATVAALVTWRKAARFTWVAAALPIAGALIVRQLQPGGQPGIQRSTLVAIGVACVAVGVALLVPNRRPAVLAVLALIALIFWDPSIREVVLQQSTLSTEDSVEVVNAYDRTDPVAAFLQEQQTNEPFRFAGYDPALLIWHGDVRTYHVSYKDPDVLALLVNNQAISLGLEDVQGYNPIQIDRYVNFMVALNGEEQSYHAANVLFRGATSPLLNLLNVRYLIVPRDVPPGRPDLLHLNQRYPAVFDNGTVRVLERTDALSRAWIVHEVIVVETDEQALALLAGGQIDPRRVVLLPAGLDPPTLATPGGGTMETVRVIDHEPDRIELAAELAVPGMLVLSELWDPGWHVRIDGKPAPVYRVDSILRGVALDTGPHTIVLEYAPRSLMVSAVFTGVGWIAIFVGYVALACRWSLGKRRGPGGPAPDVAAPAGPALPDIEHLFLETSHGPSVAQSPSSEEASVTPDPEESPAAVD